MTTAHRPTFFAAIGKAGGTGLPSRMFSSKDQVAHTKLKFRQVGQASVEEMNSRHLRQELDRREQVQMLEAEKKSGAVAPHTTVATAAAITGRAEKTEAPRLLMSGADSLRGKYDDADADVGDDSEDDLKSTDDEGDDDDDSDDDDDEDDEMELQAELERIKAERAAAALKKEQEERDAQEKVHRESAMRGNPLLNLGGGGDGSAKVKRRWNDDVVFRNQARDEPDNKKRFINDTIRSDFHRSFIKRFIK